MRPSRATPPTTIFASYPPPQIHSIAYEAPRERRWPVWLAFTFLSLVALVGIGLLAAVLIQNAGGVAVNLPDNQKLTVLAKETPTPTPTPRPTATPTPQPTVVIESTPELPQRQLAVSWSGWIADGYAQSWRLPAGVYDVTFTASGDGGTIEVAGSDDCWKTEPMLRFTRRCTLPVPGSLVVTNPSVFRTGASISATVHVMRVVED